jgi:hypothetical protein
MFFVDSPVEAAVLPVSPLPTEYAPTVWPGDAPPPPPK